MISPADSHGCAPRLRQMIAFWSPLSRTLSVSRLGMVQRSVTVSPTRVAERSVTGCGSLRDGGCGAASKPHPVIMKSVVRREVANAAHTAQFPIVLCRTIYTNRPLALIPLQRSSIKATPEMPRRDRDSGRRIRSRSGAAGARAWMPIGRRQPFHPKPGAMQRQAPEEWPGGEWPGRRPL